MLALLRNGPRKELANQVEGFIQEIVEDMAKYEGSGNAAYYEETATSIVVEFQHLEFDSLLRNAIRKSTHRNLRNEAYSEDSEADEEDERNLKVPKGHYPRRTHPDDNFAVNANLSCLEPTAYGMNFYSS